MPYGFSVSWYDGITQAWYLTTTFFRSTIRTMKPIKTMSIRLSAEQAQELDTVAAVDGQPISEVIRSAIAGHIEERKRDAAFQDSLRQRIEHARRMLPSEQK